jgi:hypothetical protein
MRTVDYATTEAVNCPQYRSKKVYEYILCTWNVIFKCRILELPDSHHTQRTDTPRLNSRLKLATERPDKLPVYWYVENAINLAISTNTS